MTSASAPNPHVHGTPDHPASLPQSALPRAMPAEIAVRYSANPRARTHEGSTS